MRLFETSVRQVEAALQKAEPGLIWSVYDYAREGIRIFVCSGKSIHWPSAAPDPEDAAQRAKDVWENVTHRLGVSAAGSKRIEITVNVHATDDAYYGVDTTGRSYGPEDNRRMR